MRSLIAFISGMATAAVSMLGACGWSFAALFALGAPIIAGALLGAGILFLSLRYAIPKLLRACTRKFIEYKIKAALKENDPEQKNLKYWLTVANGGEFNSECYRFTFSDGRSLAQYVLDEAKFNISEYQEPSFFNFSSKESILEVIQNYIKNISYFLLDQLRPLKELVVDGWLDKFIKIIGLSFDFTSKPLREDKREQAQNIFSQIKPHIEAANISVDFMKKAGLPETFLTNPDSISQPCFHNVSAPDETFDRLKIHYLESLTDFKKYYGNHLWIIKTLSSQDCLEISDSRVLEGVENETERQKNKKFNVFRTMLDCHLDDQYFNTEIDEKNRKMKITSNTYNTLKLFSVFKELPGVTESNDSEVNCRIS